MCRSRRELSNAYLLAKIGVDTAENEPLEVWGENSIQYSLHSLLRTRQLPALFTRAGSLLGSAKAEYSALFEARLTSSHAIGETKGVR